MVNMGVFNVKKGLTPLFYNPDKLLKKAIYNV